MSQLVLVLLLIGWKIGTVFLSQSCSVANAKPITFRHSRQMKTALSRTWDKEFLSFYIPCSCQLHLLLSHFTCQAQNHQCLFISAANPFITLFKLGKSFWRCCFFSWSFWWCKFSCHERVTFFCHTPVSSEFAPHWYSSLIELNLSVSLSLSQQRTGYSCFCTTLYKAADL